MILLYVRKKMFYYINKFMVLMSFFILSFKLFLKINRVVNKSNALNLVQSGVNLPSEKGN